MIDFDEKQIKILTGNFKTIGKSCGCTREYVMKILKGQQKSNGPKAQAVREKATDLLKVITPSI
jgi:hypothetical protein